MKSKKFYNDNILDDKQFEDNMHLMFSEEFYNKYVKGKEEKLRKKIKFRIISIKIFGELEFCHSSNFVNKESILKDGLTIELSSENDTLGKGIYVYEYNYYKNQNRYIKSTNQRIYFKGKCLTEYLKCVYSPENVGADGIVREVNREYLILKDVPSKFIEILQ